jgi:DNA-binding CsgD family transcriptional regulator
MSHSTEYLSQVSFTQNSEGTEKQADISPEEQDSFTKPSDGTAPIEQTILQHIAEALKHLDIRSISFFHHAANADIERSLKKAFSFMLDDAAPSYDHVIKHIQFNLGVEPFHQRLSSPEPSLIRLLKGPNNESEPDTTQENGLFVLAKAFGPYGRSSVFILSLNPSQDDPSDKDLTPVQNIVQLFFPQLLQSQRKQERAVTLTPREKEIVKWVSRGKSNPEIAQIIGISVHTVNGYLRGIYLKTQTGDRVSLSFFALHHGLLN